MDITMKKNIKRTPRLSRKQAGFTLIELMIVIGIIAVLGAIIRSGEPSAKSSSKVSSQIELIKQIKTQADKYRNNRINFSTISMTQLCTLTSLSKVICGPSNDGVATNLYGGNYVVSPVSSDPGQYTIQVTNIDAGVEPEMADGLAVYTANQAACSNGLTGCTTIATAANVVTGTFE